MKEKEYQVTGRIWLYEGSAAWHFFTLPSDVAKDIDFYFSTVKKGWGSLPVLVTLGKTQWKTSIFPDKKSQSYLLPIKAEVRKKETVKAGDIITLRILVSP